MNDEIKLEFLIKFIGVTKDGMVKPNDPTSLLQKLDVYNRGKRESDRINIEQINSCCATSSTVRDTKDFKPYINAALDKIAEILELEVKHYN